MKANGQKNVVATVPNYGKDFYLQLAMGIAGAQYAPWAKTGYNGAVGTATEDLWTLGGSYVFPAVAGIPMQVVSASGNDTNGGSGIQSVTLSYLDETYTEQTEDIVLNGGTKATVAQKIARVQNFRAKTVGANAVAAGNITLQAVGGGVNYTQIAQGYTRARNSVWTLPKGKKLYVTSLAFSSGSGAGGRDSRFTTRATYDDKAGTVLTAGTFFMPYHEILLEDSAFIRELEIPTVLPAYVDLKVSCMASADVLATSVLRGFVETL